MLEVQGDLSLAAHLTGTGSTTQDLWRYPWSVLWLAAFVWIWRLSTRVKLPLPGWLRWSREAISWNHLSFAGLQDQIPREFFPAERQPWVCLHQPYLRLLWRVQTALQYQAMEDLHRLFQLPTRSGHCWRENLLLPRWSQSWSPKHGTNSPNHEAHRCAWSGSSLRSFVVWPRQGHDGLGRKRPRCKLYFWCGSCC